VVSEAKNDDTFRASGHGMGTSGRATLNSNQSIFPHQSLEKGPVQVSGLLCHPERVLCAKCPQKTRASG
jgi:hypothetical protein